MRELNSIEKALISKVIKTKVFSFRDLFSDFFLSNVKLIINLDSKDVKICYSQNIDEKWDVFEEIITVVGLVKLLEKHNLLPKVQIEVPLNLVYYWGDLDTENKPKSTQIFGDDSLKRELVNNILAEFYITEELRIFYKNKFRTRDEIRHRKIFLVSWLAIVIALLTSAYAIWRQESKDNLDYTELSKKVVTISFKLDSMISSKAELNNCDTVKVK